MLWYKSWLETRWRFLIGLAVLMLSACGSVFAYPEVVGLLKIEPKVELTGEIGRRVSEAMELARSYRGYIWSNWFRQNMLQMWALFAVVLGTGGLLARSSGGGTLFTLSLPISRHRLLGIRATTGLAELLVLAILPSLIIPLLSPSIGQTYGIADALVHGVCMFIAGTLLFSLAVLLSTVFSDVWRPLLIVLCIAFLLAIFEEFFQGVSRYGLFRLMSAEVYFRSGGLPWQGLFATTALSAAMLYGAAINIARRDF